MQQRHENRKTYFQELATTSELHFLPYIHRFTSVTPQSRILEIGCGEGGNLVPFARIGCRVTGIDLSENRIRQARQFFQEERLPATFIASDIFQIIQLEEAFDIILIHDVIEHISEKYRLLEHIKRFLTTLYQLPSLANAFWRASADLPEQICFTPAFHSFIARRHLQQFITPLWRKPGTHR